MQYVNALCPLIAGEWGLWPRGVIWGFLVKGVNLEGFDLGGSFWGFLTKGVAKGGLWPREVILGILEPTCKPQSTMCSFWDLRRYAVAVVVAVAAVAVGRGKLKNVRQVECLTAVAMKQTLGRQVGEVREHECNIHVCDVYVGGKVRVSEFMIFLDLQHCGSK